jgi:hypothetical protein
MARSSADVAATIVTVRLVTPHAGDHPNLTDVVSATFTVIGPSQDDGGAVDSLQLTAPARRRAKRRNRD